jgi:hypothetical protein
MPTALAMMTGISLRICAWEAGVALTNTQLSALSKIMPMDVEERAVSAKQDYAVEGNLLRSLMARGDGLPELIDVACAWFTNGGEARMRGRSREKSMVRRAVVK